MRLFKRLWVEITSFFETDNTGEEEINLRNLSIIFLLGLLLLFGTYFIFYDESKLVYNLPLNIFSNIRDGVVRLYDGVVRLYDGVVRLYHRILDVISSSAIGEIKTIANSYQTISCEECKIDAKFESDQNNDTLVIDYELSHKNYLWRQVHKVFERIFDMPVDFGWVQINKELNNADWSQYKDISLLVKSTDESSNLEFSVIEEDGDVWYYFDKNSLSSKEWAEIKIPFEDFVNPGWADYGDRKKKFKNIKRIRLTITNFDEPIKNKLYFKIFDGELFKLV